MINLTKVEQSSIGCSSVQSVNCIFLLSFDSRSEKQEARTHPLNVRVSL